jgi:hypothetical protein
MAANFLPCCAHSSLLLPSAIAVRASRRHTEVEQLLDAAPTAGDSLAFVELVKPCQQGPKGVCYAAVVAEAQHGVGQANGRMVA